MKKQIIVTACGLMMAVGAGAQDERSSSSMYLQPVAKGTAVALPFSVVAEGKRYEPTWGLDQAWINEQNLRKGVNHMGKENVGIGRTAFRFTKPLTNDSVLTSDQTSHLRQRSNIFNIVANDLPLVFTADQEAGADEYYVKNKSANVPHWAANINSHVHWMQQNTKHPIVGVSPFNEPDYWAVEEGATAAKQRDVAKLLKEEYPRFADIAIVGGNTLNDDKAASWFNPGRAYYEWGNTHQLAGSFDNYAAFYTMLAEKGKVGYNDEMHNVGEAMIGLEYGMTVGIWWGFDSRARGEFCDISRHGERLAYAEHRDNWTAASVYRHDDGRVKAFVGSSERQAATTDYLFVSADREVYYDGFGPVREYQMQMPGGTGYQNGQTNAERVIDITWGEDVAPCYISEGSFRIVSKVSGNMVGASSGNTVMMKPSASKLQQWNIHLSSPRIGGDFSFYDIESVSNAMMRMNVENFSTASGANVIAYAKNEKPSSNEQWYFQYAGNGYYYIRNRETALYLTTASSGTAGGVNVITSTLYNSNNAARQLWRILPVDVDYETEAPSAPESLVATANTASVRLSWQPSPEADVEGYMVLRAEKGANNWNTVARNVRGNCFVDNTCRQGHIYIYKVKAIDKALNQSACSEEAEVSLTYTPAMIACWQMEDNMEDATANMLDGALYGKAAYIDDGISGKALRFMSSNNTFVQLPYEIASTEELTVSLWVYWRSASAWQRLFDFGSDTEHYMFLTPSTGSVMRFAIKNGGDEQTVSCKTKLATQKWKHVAVTIGKDKTAIYVDGVEEGSSTGITISPADLRPVLNYLGRSQFNADPLFIGYMDDVRIFNYALSAEEVQKLAEQTPFNGISDASQTSRTQGTVYGLGGEQLSQPRRGVNILDGRKMIVK